MQFSSFSLNGSNIDKNEDITIFLVMNGNLKMPALHLGVIVALSAKYDRQSYN